MTRVHPRPALVVASIALLIVIGLSFVVTEDDWVTRADASVVRTIAHHRTTATVDIARWVTDLGNLLVLAVVTLGFWASMRWRARRSESEAPSPSPALPALALAVAAIVDPLVKLAVGRPRPPHDLAVMIEQATGYPSGHSAQSAAAWIGIALVLGAASAHPRRWLLAGAAVTAVVGASRVVLGVHSPTDVIGGWALGLACVLSVQVALERSRRPRTS